MTRPATTGGPYRVTLSVLDAEHDWKAREAGWISFVEQLDTEVGFWCDPRVMRCECTCFLPQSVLVAEVRAGERLVALVPFKLAPARMPLRLGLATVGSVNATRAVLYDTPFAVVEGEDRQAVLALVLSELAAARRHDLVVVSEWPAPADGELPFAGARAVQHQTSHRIRMPETAEAYFAGLKGHARHEVRRHARRLESAMSGRLSLRCFRCVDECDEFHRLVEQVWRRSWHACVGGAPVPPVEFLSLAARHRWLRGYVLFGREEPLAYALGYQYRGVYSYHNTAYDPQHQALSPGSVMTFLFLQQLFESDPPELVDFGSGENRYKVMLCNETREQVGYWLPMTARGRLIVAATRALDASYRSAKRLLAGTGVVERLKRRVRGVASASPAAQPSAEDELAAQR